MDTSIEFYIDRPNGLEDSVYDESEISCYEEASVEVLDAAGESWVLCVISWEQSDDYSETYYAMLEALDHPPTGVSWQLEAVPGYRLVVDDSNNIEGCDPVSVVVHAADKRFQAACDRGKNRLELQLLEDADVYLLVWLNGKQLYRGSLGVQDKSPEVSRKHTTANVQLGVAGCRQEHPRVTRFPVAHVFEVTDLSSVVDSSLVDSRDEISMLLFGSDAQSAVVRQGIGCSSGVVHSWCYDADSRLVSAKELTTGHCAEEAARRLQNWLQNLACDAAVYVTARTEWGAKVFERMDTVDAAVIHRIKGVQVWSQKIFDMVSGLTTAAALELMQFSYFDGTDLEKLYGLKIDRLLIYRCPELRRVHGSNCAIEYGVEACCAPRLQRVWIDGPAGVMEEESVTFTNPPDASW